MSYPRKYATATASSDGCLVPADWDEMVNRVNGYTPSGSFTSPYTYLLSTDGTDYYISNAFQTVYGGPDDAGTVDGADLNACIAAAIADINANSGGKLAVARGKYQLTNTGAKLIDLDDMGNIIIEGEGPAYPNGVPIGNSDLPAGSSYGTMFMAPVDYDGIVISHEMSPGVTMGDIALKNFGVCGNTAHVNIAAGSGCTAISFGNVYSVDSLIEEVSALSCKWGFFLNGSSIEVRKTYSAYCYNGYYLSNAAEYISLITAHSYMDYDAGFHMASSGINTFIDCLTMPNSTDLHTLDPGTTWERIAPVGYDIYANQGIIMKGCTHYGPGTGWYVSGPGIWDVDYLLDGCSCYSFDTTPDAATYPCAIQIYAADRLRLHITNAQLEYYDKGIYIVKSGTSSCVKITNSFMDTCTTQLNLTLLEGSYAGTVILKNNTNYEMEHHTADDTLLSIESGTTHTNLGAADTVTLTLPQDAVKGVTYQFAVMTAQALRIDPGAAGAIIWGGAKDTDDHYIWADDEGESVTLMSDGNHDWIALYLNGTWTSEA